MNLNQYQDYIKDKKVLIWGLGLQGGGLSSALFFLKNNARVLITDLKTELELKPSLDKLKKYQFEKRLGEHKYEDFSWADTIVINQDIFNNAPNSPYLNYIIEDRKQIETEIGLFFKFCTKPIIGITGTRGKTTVATVAAQMLRNSGFKIFLGGNISSSQNLANIEKANKVDWVVLELSNYQLHGLDYVKKSPHISIITSISPDHFKSYNSMDDYINDKKIIYKYQNQEDFLIINQQIDFSRNLNTKAQVVYFDNFTLTQDWKLKLSGEHNRTNLAAAYQLGKILNINNEVIKLSLTSFSGVDFRLQKIATISGIDFINDTTATTPTAAIIALNSFSDKKIIWVGGGSSKKLPLLDLANLLIKKADKIILLSGSGTIELLEVLKKYPQFEEKFIGEFGDFFAAVNKAYQIADKDSLVLLSPGFASFGMFTNEFDRGEQFNKIVENLKTKIN